MMSSLRPKLQLVLTFCALFAGLSIVAFLDTANADQTGTRSATIVHSPTDVTLGDEVNSESNTYTSPEFTAQFKFTGVGLSWAGNANANMQFSLQVDDQPWQVVELMSEEGKSESDQYTTEPLFASGQRIRYRITGDAERIQQVKLTYFDTSIAPYRSLSKQLGSLVASTTTSDNGLHIISRSEWGADESLRTWVPEYQTPTKVVIHHTAGTNGGSDPAATIRGIYYWHTVVLGWGDIGYNYIIDGQGNIYEGRYGGNGVIGAHAYNSITDINYNVGSVGIALMGCYEDTPGACSRVNEFKPEMQTALTNLVAHTAARNHFDADGSSEWHGKVLPNVIGHRDIDYTYCPGDIVHDQLPNIRTMASAQGSSLAAIYSEYLAETTSNTLADAYSVTDSPSTNWVFQNTGSRNWESGTVKLKVKIGKRESAITLPNTVESSNSVSQELTIALPRRAGTYDVTAKLMRAGKTIAGSTVKKTITVTNPHQVNISAFNAPVAIQQGWVPNVTLTATNDGVTELPAETSIIINNHEVGTVGSVWPIGEQRTITIAVPFAAQWSTGYHTLRLKLKADSILIEQSVAQRTIRID